MSTIGPGLPAGTPPDTLAPADPAATDALYQELERLRPRGLKLELLDSHSGVRSLAERLMKDGRLDAGDVKDILKEANDYGSRTKAEMEVLGTLLREFAEKFTPEAREALSRLTGIPPGRPVIGGAPPASRRGAPNDPVSIAANVDVNKKVDAFTDWARYPYQVIVVPGSTPLDAKTPVQMHPTQKQRLAQAKKDLDDGKAPFILVSGGNVHPEGTPFNEALEMKAELIRMGVPADKIIVDAVARHSTTNLRNAGRYMLEHGLSKALVTTSGSQDFYFSFPTISTFHLRCERELGYKIGTLRDAAGPGHSVFEPSDEVKRPNLRDLRDP